ncbi:STY4528 family pathogenicity island replication protein [Chitinivorax sp. PXF-14]|uniref:STY4528 family pathogenicity island replication protein n=1 Tax=Chitinivorax sp. PXF-14 TaxID=3230488 RepID=UPI003466CE1E
MATGGAPRRDGPMALSALFDDALQNLAQEQGPAPAGDGFLYSGNRHESVPRALFLDRRLTPLERNAWQVFRLQLNDDGVTAFPTYDQLRPYLASIPCGSQASHETVARALTLLRLTRWLSLVRRRRDPKTGRILGNLYVLHDEPLTPFEAMQLDPDYLGLVSQALTHAAKAVQIVGMHTLKEIAEDPLLSGRTLPTRLQVLTQHMARHGWTAPSYPQGDVGLESEEGQETPLRNDERPSSESEVGPKPAPEGSLRNPKEDRTVRKDRIDEVRTVPRAKALQSLRLPERFLRLKEEQQAGAMIALQQVEETQRQAVLDEWAARCRSSTVRSPAGYLFGIIQKAIRGEFKAWAGHAVQENAPPSPLSPGDSASAPSTREVALQHIAKLRDKLQLR